MQANSCDALGRREWKSVNGVKTWWTSFGNQEIAEYQGTATPVLSRRFVYAAGIDEPVASPSCLHASGMTPVTRAAISSKMLSARSSRLPATRGL